MRQRVLTHVYAGQRASHIHEPQSLSEPKSASY